MTLKSTHNGTTTYYGHTIGDTRVQIEIDKKGKTGRISTHDGSLLVNRNGKDIAAAAPLMFVSNNVKGEPIAFGFNDITGAHLPEDIAGKTITVEPQAKKHGVVEFSIAA